MEVQLPATIKTGEIEVACNGYINNFDFNLCNVCIEFSVIPK